MHRSSPPKAHQFIASLKPTLTVYNKAVCGKWSEIKLLTSTKKKPLYILGVQKTESIFQLLIYFNSKRIKGSSLYHSAFRVLELKNYHLHQHDAVWKHQIQYLVHLSIKNTKYLTSITFINVIQCLGNVVCNMGLIIYHCEKQNIYISH